MLSALLPLQVILGLGLASPALPNGVIDSATNPTVSSVSAPADTTPVEVTLFDVNHKESVTVTIGADGAIDAATREALQHAFRCKRTGRERKMDKGMLAMVAAVGKCWPGKTISYVSAYRAHKHESKTS